MAKSSKTVTKRKATKAPAKKKVAKKAAAKRTVPKKKAIKKKVAVKKSKRVKKSPVAKKKAASKSRKPAARVAKVATRKKVATPKKKTNKLQPKKVPAPIENNLPPVEEKSPDINTNNIIAPGMDNRSLQVAAARNYDNHNIRLSNKKGGIKPSGKKPLW